MKENKTPQEKVRFSMPLNKNLLKYVAAILFMIAITYILVAKPQKIGDIISTIASLIMPFIIGFCLAYIVNLILRPLEKFWMWIWRKLKNQKLVTIIKRPLCLLLSFLIVLGALFAIVFIVIPEFKDTVISFSGKIPEYISDIDEWYDEIVKLFANYNFELPSITFDAARVTKIVTDVISKYGDNVLDMTASIVSTVVDIVLGIVFAIYLLAKKEKLGRQFKKATFAVCGETRAKKLVNLATLSNDVFTKFVTGQLTEACIIGILCFIGMLIFRMPYAGVISVLIGFTALIPMFGSFIGTGIGAFLILLESPIKAVWFIVFIIVLQQLEGNLIYPKVVGKSVGLPGIWVLVAVTVGGGLFGVVGMLFGVPICTVVYVLFRKFVNNKTKKINIDCNDDIKLSEEQ